MEMPHFFQENAKLEKEVDEAQLSSQANFEPSGNMSERLSFLYWLHTVRKLVENKSEETI